MRRLKRITVWISPMLVLAAGTLGVCAANAGAAQMRSASARLTTSGRAARGTRFPPSVGPLVQQGEKLIGGGELGEGGFGTSVALSADGSTALIGAPYDNKGAGAVWVFTRSGSTWSQQGEKLAAGGEVGEGGFGTSVALSADGSTALIGAPYDNKDAGAVWVFTRSGSTWSQQGEKLTGGGESGEADFGVGVALSADGNTGLIGGPYDGTGGAAWAFTRSGSAWTQQGEKLTGAGEHGAGEFGFSVALAGEGNSALIGGPYDSKGVGAAWMFTRSGSSWTQQGEKLTGTGESGEGAFGYSTALPDEGATALVGAPHDNGFAGAAYAFARSGSAWSQQAELTGRGELDTGYFGNAVALSGSGDTALIGAPYDASAGAAWLFTRSGTTWSQQGAKLSAAGESGEGAVGYGVALSKEASTALLGGPFDGIPGAAWVFVAPPPTVNGLSPKKGSSAGGTAVTIAGTGFASVKAVDFGSVPASAFTVNSPNSITAVAPAAPRGKVDVTVTTASGKSATWRKDRFKYTR